MISKRLLGLSTIIISSILAIAKPADPRPRVFTQPDGSTVTVYLRGDERSHCYLSEDGYLLARDGDNFTYGKVLADGTIASTGVSARDIAHRTADEKAFIAEIDRDATVAALQRRAQAASTRKKAPSRADDGSLERIERYGLFPDAYFPVFGSPHVLVLLVQYSDVSFTLDDPYTYFHEMLTKEGFDSYGGTGSVLEYFTDNSMGKYTPVFDIYGPVTLPHNRKYYGGNDFMGDDQRPEQMVIDACNILDDTVDFSIYDTNGDGYVDNVYIYYAGQGEASYGGEDTVWPHAWSVSASGKDPGPYDGVKLDSYGCSNEWELGRPDGIGTFVHEFSHVMGLPDLYTTSYSSAFTPGEWSVLDYGPYNNDGCTPPNYSIFERNAVGWMTPMIIDGPCDVDLDEITSNQGCIIPTPKATEFFLLENRQQTGWDKYIPGHGMLIWHVDYKSSVWSGNTVNNNSSHQYVDIEEADNTRTDRSRAGDAFPGTKNVTSFTDTTTPSMKTWTNKALNLPITDIVEQDGFITFKVAGGSSKVTDILAAGKTCATAAAGCVTATGTPGDSVSVYDTAGRLVASGTVGADGRCSLPTQAKGLVVVRVGNSTAKLTLR